MLWRAAAFAALAYLLYFNGLTAAGMLGPDEPRYAAIGREMARSGDWVTPRLWGEPWFEKPALLYWMDAVGFRAGLGPDLAPRIGVALAGTAFLVFFFLLLKREFGEQAAFFATLILGTSPGWMAYSRVGVTDLPMAAAFSAAILLSLEWVDKGNPRRLPAVAVLLGVGVLAKGLVPLVLAAPLAWMGRRHLADLLRPRVWGAFLAVAAPWYALCYWQNGAAFVDTFFWQHQVGRFTSDALQHQQPFWFYAPVLLAGLAPWTPLAVMLGNRKLYSDRRLLFLLLVAAFGLVFFSAARNKLPGYLLPLIPPLAAMMGTALARTQRATAPLVACAVLLIAVPAAAHVLPAALESGITHAARPPFSWIWLVPLALAAATWRAPSTRTAMLLVGAGAVAGALYVQTVALPLIDRQVSARPLWREIESRRTDICLGDIHRDLAYGLNYYAVTPLPDCEDQPKPLEISQDEAGPGRVIGRR